MNDIEDRLRTGLHDLADTVPPSQHARADLNRRLARRRPKRSTLAVAAAAAVVVAGVAVPVALNQDQGSGNQPMATSQPASSTTSQPEIPGFMVNDIAPMVLGRFTENGVEKEVQLFLGKFADETDGFCVGVTPPEESRPAYAITCEGFPTWPVNPGESLVMTRELLRDGSPGRDTGPVPDLMLFMTAPQVAKLDVGRYDGAPVAVREVTRSYQRAAFFVADFDGPKSGFRYTAWDNAGNALESAIE